MRLRQAMGVTTGAAIGLATLLAGCQATGGRDVVYQTSTIDALLSGVYDGPLTCGQLKEHGDIGLGTFEALDGEMVVVDATVYRIDSAGRVQAVPDAVRTPFAVVTPFEADQSCELIGPMDYTPLAAELDRRLPSANLIYAVRITGRFDRVLTRSVPRQKRPYPPLTEVVKGQPTFELRGVTGTMVGFRFPAYAGSLNVPGWHLHFVDAGRQLGGHVLELTAREVRVELDVCDGLRVSLPRSDGFLHADLAPRSADEMHQVEK